MPWRNGTTERAGNGTTERAYYLNDLRSDAIRSKTLQSPCCSHGRAHGGVPGRVVAAEQPPRVGYEWKRHPD